MNALMPGSGQDTPSGPADPHKVREFWLDVVRPAADAGKLEKLPTVKGVGTRGRDVARTQNQWLTRKSFGGNGDSYRANYERIFRGESNGRSA